MVFINKIKISDRKTVLDLPPTENNPRNSEGDFARLKGGSILFAYSRYSGDSSHDDACCDIYGYVSKDNGESFEPLEKPIVQASEHGIKNIMSVSLKRLANGELCLFYLAKFGRQSTVFLRRAKEDELSFGEAECCVNCKEGVYYVINNSRICLLSDGRVILPLAVHKIKKKPFGEEYAEYFGTAEFFISKDETCKEFESLCELKMPKPGCSKTGIQEPGVIELNTTHYYAYFRTDRGFHFESTSEDLKNWSAPVASEFSGPDSPMLIIRNEFDEQYYSVWNPVANYKGRLTEKRRWVTGGRNPLVIARSEDGVDFGETTELERDKTKGFCYPAIMFLSENEMLISYCCGGEEDGTCLCRTKIDKIKFI